MKLNYILKTLSIFCFSFLIIYGSFLSNHYKELKKKHMETQVLTANFVEPKYELTQNNNLTRVEIDVRDDLISNYGRINKVVFNNHELKLQSADQEGNRGSTFFQLRPGIYTFYWTVKNSGYSWPREMKMQKQIKVKKNSKWIHIYINGKKITIS